MDKKQQQRSYLTEKGFLAMDSAEQSQKGRERLRTLWRMASDGWKLKRVSMARWKKAIELLKAVHHEWELTDLELQLCGSDSDTHKRVIKAQQEAIDDLTALCKQLGLTLEIGTFAHVFDSQKGQII